MHSFLSYLLGGPKSQREHMPIYLGLAKSFFPLITNPVLSQVGNLLDILSKKPVKPPHRNSPRMHHLPLYGIIIRSLLLETWFADLLRPNSQNKMVNAQFSEIKRQAVDEQKDGAHDPGNSD